MLVTHDPQRTLGLCHAFASGLASSRAQSMKRAAKGLKVRFFKVMIPTGRGRAGNFTASPRSDVAP